MNFNSRLHTSSTNMKKKGKNKIPTNLFSRTASLSFQVSGCPKNRREVRSVQTGIIMQMILVVQTTNKFTLRLEYSLINFGKPTKETQEDPITDVQVPAI